VTDSAEKNRYRKLPTSPERVDRVPKIFTDGEQPRVLVTQEIVHLEEELLEAPEEVSKATIPG
jgi:hypothetical protein